MLANQDSSKDSSIILWQGPGFLKMSMLNAMSINKGFQDGCWLSVVVPANQKPCLEILSN